MTSGRTDVADPLIGQSVGSYVVERRLGEGGMGAVYELRHPGIGKRLALKLLHAEYAARPQIVQRFFDEARAVNLIGHPNIVDIIDFSQLPDGRSYITMEFLDGESLADTIRRRGPMPAAEVADILVSIASALQAAHDAGIVHRDLKPENIHLVPRPHNPRYVKVLDFGIAKLSGDLQSQGGATRSGVVMGTPTYMSPEQAMGRTREIDHRTDIYALGVIGYQMLAGQVPFAAESFGDLMLKHLQEPPPPLGYVRPDLSPQWDTLLRRALAKRREDRFASMDDLAAAVRAASAGYGPSAGAAAAPTMAMAPSTPLAPPPAIAGVPPPADHGSGGYPGPTPAGHYPTPLSGAHTVPPDPLPPNRPWLVPAVVAAILGLAAVAVVLILRGGGDGLASATAPPAPDGAAAPIAAPEPESEPDVAEPAVAAPIAPEPAQPDAGVSATPPEPGPAPTSRPTKPSKPSKPKPSSGGAQAKGEGTVKILAIPWAEVSINGEPKGYTPLTIKLPEGRHTIVLENGELGKRETKKVTIAADRTVPIKVDWRK